MQEYKMFSIKRYQKHRIRKIFCHCCCCYSSQTTNQHDMRRLCIYFFFITKKKVYRRSRNRFDWIFLLLPLKRYVTYNNTAYVPIWSERHTQVPTFPCNKTLRHIFICNYAVCVCVWMPVQLEIQWQSIFVWRCCVRTITWYRKRRQNLY